MAPATSASLRERIAAEKARESSREKPAEGGLLPNISQALPGAPAALSDCTWTRTDDTAEPSSPSSPPLPSARRPARPRKKLPQRGRLGIDLFSLWEKAGRINTPVSAWRTGRDLLREAERPGGFVEGSTMRSALVGPARLPSPPRSVGHSPDSASAPSAFEGTWVSRVDGDLRGRIEGAWLVWADDGSRTRVRVIKSHSRGGSGDVLAMTVDGEAHSGVLSEDGHVLRWRDGDRWLRVDASYEQMQSYVEEQQRHDLQDLVLQGWSVTDRCVWARQLQSLSRPTTASTLPSTPGPTPRGGRLASRSRPESPGSPRPATANH